MYRSIDDFLATWKQEREATMKVLSALTPESLQQAVVPGGRTLGFLAWHITLSVSEMADRSGLKVGGPEEESPAPATLSGISAEYERTSEAVGDQVRSSWNDSMLGESVPMFGESWKRGALLAALIRHQAHHRAQMTVLMRQAGLRVPGIYGPSREEWTAWGRTPPR